MRQALAQLETLRETISAVRRSPRGAEVKVLVGGTSAVTVHAARLPNQPGKDVIQFLVPLDAPAGCNTPVQVVTGLTIYSNIVTMAIDPKTHLLYLPAAEFSKTETVTLPNGKVRPAPIKDSFVILVIGNDRP